MNAIHPFQSKLNFSKSVPYVQSQPGKWFNRNGRHLPINWFNEDKGLIQEHWNNLNNQSGINIKLWLKIDFTISKINANSMQEQDIQFHDNSIKGEETSFTQWVNVPQILINNLTGLKWTIMTPIQKAVIPYVNANHDIMGCSETGSGKTIAYLFPILCKLLIQGPPKNVNNQGHKANISAEPVVLILVPTRELADQVLKESRKLCFGTGINTVKIYGGVPYDSQLQQLHIGCDILVATPGRWIDYLKSNTISLGMVNTLIIDEADRILDMGFEEQLNSIVFNFGLINKEQRQNLLFSATFTKEIRNIAKKFMNDFFLSSQKT